MVGEKEPEDTLALVEPEENLEANESSGEYGRRMFLQDIVRNFSVK